jgi:hypothetical protein
MNKSVPIHNHEVTCFGISLMPETFFILHDEIYKHVKSENTLRWNNKKHFPSKSEPYITLMLICFRE